MDYNEIVAWMQLIRTNNIGPRTFWDLLQVFKTATNAVEHVPIVARRRGASNVKVVSRDIIEKEIEETEKFGAQIILGCDSLYPDLLSIIPDRPPILIVKGNTALLKRRKIAIIGSRNASTNGLSFTANITTQISEKGYIVVSGMARGIDAIAHQSSLSNGTIAVIAGGINDIYPKENTKIYHQICEQGLMISEAPINSSPLSKFFPQRNRIIAGMSKAVIVMEAKQRSGTIITAKMAIGYGHTVFAVPGFPFDPRYGGTNNLIQQGAKLMQSAQEVISYLENLKITELWSGAAMDVINFNNVSSIPEENILQEYRPLVMARLSYNPTNIEDIAEQLNIPIQIVNWIIVELEITGTIERSYGNKACLLYRE